MFSFLVADLVAAGKMIKSEFTPDSGLIKEGYLRSKKDLENEYANRARD